MSKPFSIFKSYCINNSTDRPVCKHSDPHCDRSHMKNSRKYHGKHDSAKPHTQHGGRHCKSNIPCCPESIWWNKCHDPHDWFYDCDTCYHEYTKFCTLWFHASKICDRISKPKHQKTCSDQYNFCCNGNLLYILDCFFFFSCSKTFSNDCHQSDPHSDRHDPIQVLDDIGHSLCCDRRRSHQRYR